MIISSSSVRGALTDPIGRRNREAIAGVFVSLGGGLAYKERTSCG